jgi:hypothetical protein
MLIDDRRRSATMSASRAGAFVMNSYKAWSLASSLAYR